MEADHREQMKLYEHMPGGRLLFAMAMLSDVVDGQMSGEDLRNHVNDVKEILSDCIQDEGEWEKVGAVGVDSGRLLITDYQDHPTVQREAIFDRLGKSKVPLVCEVPFERGHPGAAVSVSTGLGDGIYDVEAKIGEVPGWGTRVKEIRIRFIPHPILGP